MIKVYLASHYTRKPEIIEHAAELERLGITVVSRWHKEKHKPTASQHSISGATLRNIAKRDIEELDEATHLVLLTVDPDFKFTRGGHCFEDGYAKGKGKERALVGPRQLVFHYLPGTRRFEIWKTCRDWLIEENKRYRELPPGPGNVKLKKGG